MQSLIPYKASLCIVVWIISEWNNIEISTGKREIVMQNVCPAHDRWGIGGLLYGALCWRGVLYNILTTYLPGECPPPPKQSVYWAPIFLLHILLSAKIIIQIETNIIHCLVSLRMKYFRAIQFILDWQRKKWSKFENKFIFCLCPTHSIFCILFKWTVITSSRNVSRWLRRLSTAPWLSTRRPWKTCSLHRLNHIICSTCVISLELFKVSVCQDLKPQSQQQP